MVLSPSKLEITGAKICEEYAHKKSEQTGKRGKVVVDLLFGVHT